VSAESEKPPIGRGWLYRGENGTDFSPLGMMLTAVCTIVCFGALLLTITVSANHGATARASVGREKARMCASAPDPALCWREVTP